MGRVAIPGAKRQRYRFEIWADVLEGICEQRSQPGPLRTSRVRSQANLPHDRFWDHVEQMAELGLLDDGDELELTPHGRRFIDDVDDVANKLARYGLA
ncbi:hypothetical protein BRD56_12430 [Thermoplasmatales archaeon SW_10_69_26]|nr:MAG: hypothetical protein BRD56_12430 [Thermoplasmatales archaeon SW_10_69_26]